MYLVINIMNKENEELDLSKVFIVDKNSIIVSPEISAHVKDEILVIENGEDLEIGNNRKKNPYPLDNINIEKAYFSVFEMKRKLGKAITNVVLDSAFQRDSCWKNPQKIELVESVLMGLPLPLFYFNRNVEGKLIVVDGRQRLTALFDYMDDKFALKDLKILPEKYEKKFSELDPISQSKIEDYQLQANIIVPPTSEQVKFDIFDRVNRGGLKLNKQEIRNALHQGKSTELLNKTVKLELFKEITGDAFDKDDRMKAQYFILRFISFYLWKNGRFNIDGEYKYIDSDELFSFTMDYINELDDISGIELTLEKTMSNCKTYLDPEVFRLNSNGKRTPINMNVFETVMYIMSKIDKKHDVSNVSDKVYGIKKNVEFIKNIGNHRDGEKNVLWRFNMAEKIAKEIEND